MLAIVFTKDRPDRVEKTIPQWKNSFFPVIVLDDSADKKNREFNENYAKQFGLIYHGTEEQNKIKIKYSDLNLNLFTNKLGKQYWNLGFNRNYAILLTIIYGEKNVIFSDDDVILDNEIIKECENSLREKPFFGTNINLMPDHSIIGHLYDKIGEIIQPQYTSGTFIGIDISKTEFPFLNIYNEDWIWLCMENKGKKVEKHLEIQQLLYDPFKNWTEKVCFQENGEIFWEGIYNAFSNDCTFLLNSKEYWDEIIDNRIKRIEYLIGRFKQITDIQYNYNEIISYTLIYLKKQKNSKYVDTYNSFSKTVNIWKDLKNELQKRCITSHS